MVNVLDAKVKKDLLQWFVRLQLSEYIVLFADDQDVSLNLPVIFLPISLEARYIMLVLV